MPNAGAVLPGEAGRASVILHKETNPEKASVLLPLSGATCMYSPAISRDQYRVLSLESQAVADRLVKRQAELEEFERNVFLEAQRLREKAKEIAIREAEVEAREVQVKELESVIAARWEAIDEAFMELNAKQFWN
jgi:hypothetical protein